MRGQRLRSGNIDTDNIAIATKGRSSASRWSRCSSRRRDQKQRGNIEEIFREADIWFPPSCRRQIRRPRQMQTKTSDVRKHAAPNAAREMQASDAKLASVVDLVGTNTPRNFCCFSTYGSRRANLQDSIQNRLPQRRIAARTLADEVTHCPHLPDRSLGIDQLEYEVGHIDISSDIVDMLADNLDPRHAQRQNTLFLYGQITSGLPLSLLLDPSFSPTRSRSRSSRRRQGIERHSPNAAFRRRPAQIVEGITIRFP